MDVEDARGGLEQDADLAVPAGSRVRVGINTRANRSLLSSPQHEFCSTRWSVCSGAMGDEVWRFVRDLEALAVRSGMRVAELRVSGRGPARGVTVTFEKMEVAVDGVERDGAAMGLDLSKIRAHVSTLKPVFAETSNHP